MVVSNLDSGVGFCKGPWIWISERGYNVVESLTELISRIQDVLRRISLRWRIHPRIVLVVMVGGGLRDLQMWGGGEEGGLMGRLVAAVLGDVICETPFGFGLKCCGRT